MFKKKIACLCLGILFIAANVSFAAGRTRQVVDDAGRTKDINANITKVFSTSPMGTIFMYCLNPKKIAGLSWQITAEEKKYTSAEYQKLPYLGGNFGGKKNTMNFEVILKVKPDFILSVGDIDDMAVSDADALEKKLGIPVLLYDGSLEKTAETFLKLGDVTGEKKRSRELSLYIVKSLKETKSIVAKIPENGKIRLYYAEGVNGLETDPEGSSHSELVELCGGINVAEGQILRGYGRTGVSIEQVLSWNPELIIVCTDQGFSEGGFFDKIYTDPVWANINAVKNRCVYEIPYAPFNWFDRPPSANRIIGIKWLANLLYPEHFKYDIKKETKDFYKLFYNRVLTDGEVDDILKNSLR